MPYACVYILASGCKHLYIGVTSDIEVRVAKHKNKTHPGSFTAKYGIDQLVYFERFADIHAAIAREKQLKRWSRVMKIRLIVAANPDWRDLSAEWGTALPSWDGVLKPVSDLTTVLILVMHSHFDRNTGVSPLRFAPVETTSIMALQAKITGAAAIRRRKQVFGVALKATADYAR